MQVDDMGKREEEESKTEIMRRMAELTLELKEQRKRRQQVMDEIHVRSALSSHLAAKEGSLEPIDPSTLSRRDAPTMSAETKRLGFEDAIAVGEGYSRDDYHAVDEILAQRRREREAAAAQHAERVRYLNEQRVRLEERLKEVRQWGAGLDVNLLMQLDRVGPQPTVDALIDSVRQSLRHREADLALLKQKREETLKIIKLARGRSAYGGELGPQSYRPEQEEAYRMVSRVVEAIVDDAMDEIETVEDARQAAEIQRLKWEAADAAIRSRLEREAKEKAFRVLSTELLQQV